MTGLIIAALISLLGVITSQLFRWAKRWSADWRINQSDVDVLVPKTLGHLGDISSYSLQSIHSDRQCAMLTDDRFLFFRPVNFENDVVIHVTDPERVDYDIDQRLVRQARSEGRRFTNSPILYLVGYDEHQLKAGVTGYRSSMTLAARVSRSILQSTSQRPSVYKNELRTLQSALSSDLLRPLNFGSDATCVFWDGQKYVTPVHRRSHQTINAPGAITVTPAYTYELNTSEGIRSRFGIIGYNFLREFLEEFWGEKKIAEMGSRPRANPDFMFDTTLGRKLIAEVDAGRVELWCTGIGVDLSHVCCSVALTARFTSPEFLMQVRNAPGHIELNEDWLAEMDTREGESALRFPELFGDQMNQMLLGKIKPTTLFSVDRARVLVQGLTPPQED